MARKGTGVELQGNSIRLVFMYEGKKVHERLTQNGKSLPPTATNVKLAHQIAIEIRKKIELGIFKFAEYFPDSKRVVKEETATSRREFSYVAELWLKSKKGDIGKASYYKYECAIKFWKRFFAERYQTFGRVVMMDQIDAKELKAEINSYSWSSPKNFNNHIIPLRGIFEFEFSGERQFKNPLLGVKSKKVPKKPAECLNPIERDLVLDYMKAHYDVRVYAYFLFAFYTGMRPQELIALRWSDVDWRKETIKVQRVRYFHGEEREGTKTQQAGEFRIVDLRPEAIAALHAMRPYTFNLTENEDESSPDIFQNPKTEKSWCDEQAQRDKYWNPALEALEMRPRKSSSTRHTFATWLLMMGVAEAYIKVQLGHEADSLMIHQHYTKWDQGTAHDQYRAAVDRIIADAKKLSTENTEKVSLNNPYKVA